MKRANPLHRFARWLTRLLLRVGLLPASAKADTDTMGEWKRLQEEKDDPLPGLMLPDPNAPHAALIRRVRLYAQNGAKALAPLLDAPAPDTLIVGMNAVGLCHAAAGGDLEALSILEAMSETTAHLSNEQVHGMVLAIHAAYNSPWTVVDGEVYEFETEKRKRVVQ